uniref:Uncharacterized protein n=1 Tax=Aegilops tauschii subsp. strangulata TaxID=200361 RepID=A0A453LJX0_AEGTS
MYESPPLTWNIQIPRVRCSSYTSSGLVVRFPSIRYWVHLSIDNVIQPAFFHEELLRENTKH